MRARSRFGGFGQRVPARRRPRKGRAELAVAEQATLGEILAAALTEPQPLADPQPIGLAEQVIIQAITDEAFRHFSERNAQAMVASGRALARSLAPILDASPDEVFNVLGHVPDNMLELLKSPQGWTALAGYVATDMGRPLPNFKPTVN